MLTGGRRGAKEDGDGIRGGKEAQETLWEDDGVS